ncbi:unnamed protein product [Sphagnum jensenii]
MPIDQIETNHEIYERNEAKVFAELDNILALIGGVSGQLRALPNECLVDYDSIAASDIFSRIAYESNKTAIDAVFARLFASLKRVVHDEVMKYIELYGCSVENFELKHSQSYNTRVKPLVLNEPLIEHGNTTMRPLLSHPTVVYDYIRSEFALIEYVIEDWFAQIQAMHDDMICMGSYQIPVILRKKRILVENVKILKKVYSKIFNNLC